MNAPDRMQMKSVRALWSDRPAVDAMVARKALMSKPASARGGQFDAPVLKTIGSLLLRERSDPRFMGATRRCLPVHTVCSASSWFVADLIELACRSASLPRLSRIGPSTGQGFAGHGGVTSWLQPTSMC